MIHKTQTVSAGATGDPIDISGGPAGVALICTDSAKLQYTMSEDLSSANWIDWPKGVVTGNVGDVLLIASGVRQVNSGAAASTLEVVVDA